MSRSVEILAADWRRLREAHPEADDRGLVEEMLGRGRGILGDPPEDRIPSDLPAPERLARLRRWFPRKAASVAVQRFDFVTSRERFALAADRERESYERHLELDKDIVPPLKEEAKALRGKIRELEARVRARGIDPDRIEPRIDWRSTLAVDAYERPRYETNETRRRAAVDFFRRVGEGR